MIDLSTLDPILQQKIQYWLSDDFDTQTKNTIHHLLTTNREALIDSFYTDLSFGTGGLRALMGVGTNRLNIYTIRLLTQALANYILKTPSCEKKQIVVIGYDSRHHSREFAEEVAKVLAGNGITAFIFPDIRPTPYTSFACRFLHARAAVMITASHNPKEYNGYKVYWSDGAQVVPPHDIGILKETKNITHLSQVLLAPISSPLICTTDKTLDEAYWQAIYPLQLSQEQNAKQGHKLKIAYTSLHGTGITLAPEALRREGFTNIEYVKEQIKPDGDFPTVAFPNPEYKETLKLGIDLLTSKQCHILLANDPDADRLGVVILHQGNPIILSGNDLASICIHYLCSMLENKQLLSPKSAFVTTIVSTRLIKKIVDSFGAHFCEVLTGFKYIGEKIHDWEQEKEGYHFIFGAEESYGYLLGTVTRDKDAIITSCLVAEIALHYFLKGATLLDTLYELYKTYGVHKEGQISLEFSPGKEGEEKIQTIMQYLRHNLPTELCGKKIVAKSDYLAREEIDLVNNKTIKLTLPVSDVIILVFADESRLVIRPSGTEPKIKIYGSVCASVDGKNVIEGIASCEKQLKDLLTSAKLVLCK